ncbi:hypothetical protein Vi05172_g4613 [Venturia inaequalis]|nr:hypothetical protein Vi05172_g4613 [Venturia inaequalis]
MTSLPYSSRTVNIAGSVADLTVHVGEDEYRQPVRSFKVLTSTMRMHSPAWDAMLRPDGSFAENGSNDVRFPADDADAFEVVLNVLHGHVDMVPNAFTLEALHNLAKICDEYFVVAPIRPIISNERLPAGPNPQLEERYRVPLHDAWLTICWVFGLEEQFRTHLKATITHVIQTQDQPQVPMTLAPIVFDCLPEGMGNYIIEQMKDHFQKLLDDVLSNKDLVHGLCSNPSNSNLCFVDDWTTELCCSTMLGSLIRERHRIAEALDKVCAQRIISVGELADLLRTIQILTWSSAHERCPDKLRLKETIDDILSAPLKLLDAHQAHFDSF